jgi:hypothetical protein
MMRILEDGRPIFTDVFEVVLSVNSCLALVALQGKLQFGYNCCILVDDRSLLMFRLQHVH